MTSIDPSEISLILPGQSAPDGLSVDGMPPVVWLRNPKTGVIHKFLRPQQDDTIARCLGERYTPSSEAAARAQAIELAKIQGRPLPDWAFVVEAAEPVSGVMNQIGMPIVGDTGPETLVVPSATKKARG